VYASGSDLIESRKTHANGKRMIPQLRIRTKCLAIGAMRLRRRARRGRGLDAAAGLRRIVSVRIANAAS
jgi:hypothetical protein